MPMYEKGSVRAEPRSKQQERMKKIMKKFLSSLLALTMILSLVIVPAQAHDGLTVGKGTATITAKVGTSDVPEKGVASGTQVTFTVTGTPTVTGTEEGATVTYTRKRLRSLPIRMLLRPLLRPLLIGAGLIMSPVLLVIILLRSKSLPMTLRSAQITLRLL